jgi:hypothetical protein
MRQHLWIVNKLYLFLEMKADLRGHLSPCVAVCLQPSNGSSWHNISPKAFLTVYTTIGNTYISVSQTVVLYWLRYTHAHIKIFFLLVLSGNEIIVEGK